MKSNSSSIVTLLATLVVILVTCPAQAAITVYYDFEGDFKDHQAAGVNADDLTATGGSLVSDAPGNAVGSTQSYQFDNSSTYQTAQTVDFSLDLASTNAYTVMFWFKGDDLLQGNSNTRLISLRFKADNSGAADPALQVEGFGQGGANSMDMRLNEPVAGVLWFSPDATGVLDSDSNAANDVWHHIAFVFSNHGSPNNNLAYSQTYVDGVSVGISEVSASTGNPIGNTEGKLIIGGRSGIGLSATGFIDDFALFDDIVSAEIIAAIANGDLSAGFELEFMFSDGFE